MEAATEYQLMGKKFIRDVSRLLLSNCHDTREEAFRNNAKCCFIKNLISNNFYIHSGFEDPP